MHLPAPNKPPVAGAGAPNNPPVAGAFKMVVYDKRTTMRNLIRNIKIGKNIYTILTWSRTK